VWLFIMVHLVGWPLVLACFVRNLSAAGQFDEEVDLQWHMDFFRLTTDFAIRPLLPPPLACLPALLCAIWRPVACARAGGRRRGGGGGLFCCCFGPGSSANGFLIYFFSILFSYFSAYLCMEFFYFVCFFNIFLFLVFFIL
jgi:hypothetical protein